MRWYTWHAGMWVLNSRVKSVRELSFLQNWKVQNTLFPFAFFIFYSHKTSIPVIVHTTRVRSSDDNVTHEEKAVRADSRERATNFPIFHALFALTRMETLQNENLRREGLAQTRALTQSRHAHPHSRHATCTYTRYAHEKNEKICNFSERKNQGWE